MGDGMTTYKQLTIFDLFPKLIPDPPLWECMNTCANSRKYMDKFPLGGDRCIYGLIKDGTTGNDLYQKISNDVVQVYCKYYERVTE